MRSVLITLAAGIAALLLSGCPDVPRGIPAKASQGSRAAHENLMRAPHDDSTHAKVAVHHSVGEIAWFQGTLDEAFSGRGCPQSRPRRGLFRF